MQRKIIFDNLLGYLVSSRGQLHRNYHPWVCCPFKDFIIAAARLHRGRTSQRRHHRHSKSVSRCLKQPGVPPAHWCQNSLAQLCTKDQEKHLGLHKQPLLWAVTVNFKQRNNTISSLPVRAFLKRSKVGGRLGNWKTHEAGIWQLWGVTGLMSTPLRWRCRSAHDVVLVQIQRSENRGSLCCSASLKTRERAHCPGWGSVSPLPIG